MPQNKKTASQPRYEILSPIPGLVSCASGIPIPAGKIIYNIFIEEDDFEGLIGNLYFLPERMKSSFESLNIEELFLHPAQLLNVDLVSPECKKHENFQYMKSNVLDEDLDAFKILSAQFINYYELIQDFEFDNNLRANNSPEYGLKAFAFPIGV